MNDKKNLINELMANKICHAFNFNQVEINEFIDNCNNAVKQTKDTWRLQNKPEGILHFSLFQRMENDKTERYFKVDLKLNPFTDLCNIDIEELNEVGYYNVLMDSRLNDFSKN